MRVLILVISLIHTFNVHAYDAFGAPGLPPVWSSAKKVHVGTHYNAYAERDKSYVWLSATDGVLTEVFYPHVDNPQLRDSQLVITDRQGNIWQEKNSLDHVVEIIHPSAVKLTNYERNGKFAISHTFYTLKNTSTVVDEIEITANEQGLNFYLLVNPHLNNSGYGDSGYTTKNTLNFYEGQTRLSVYSSRDFVQTSVGFVGFSDGYQDLLDNGRMDFGFDRAINGNIAGMALLDLPRTLGVNKFRIMYDFSDMKPQPTDNSLNEYYNSWNKYFDTISKPGELSETEEALYWRSIFTIKTHEDKLQPGAMAASLSKPWGDLFEDTSSGESGGYHLTWPRDLFHKAISLLNSGDVQTPYYALLFLKKIQFKSGVWYYGDRIIPRAGAFPQNVWTSGNEYWTGLQLDQVGYPIQLFYHLWRRLGASEQAALFQEFQFMLRQAADFIAIYGPWSAQERWEENFGISPSTFSVATAALKMASEIFNDKNYSEIANRWLTKEGDNIFTWTYTTSGIYGDGEYFVRISGCENYLAEWNPNSNQSCHISNSTKRFDQRAILDQGFLKLALMGLVDAKDERIKKSVDVINSYIAVQTPRGVGWYRYTSDSYGYGEDYIGRLWPLLGSEHGRYYLELMNEGALSPVEANVGVNTIIQSFIGFANEGLMIPEQVFEDSGRGTGGATPLAWSHAEYIKMLWSRYYQINIENAWDLYGN